MTDVPPIAPAFTNRRPGLIGCGIVYLAFGLLLLGMCGLMVIGLVMGPQAGQAETPKGMLVYVSLFYLALAAMLATLGIGSIMARRWSRPLILIVSWGWLLMGVITAVMMVFIMPIVFETLPRDQQGAKSFVMGCMFVMCGLVGIAVPVTFILFYRGKDVKATVETLDPTPRWTDRVPMPLLAFSVWTFFGAVSVAVSSFMYKALPLGGMMLRGWQAKALMWLFAALMVWIAVGTLRRMPAAWWSGIAMLVLGVAYGVTFASRGDYAMWAEALGVQQDRRQVAMMEAMYSSPFFYVWMGVVWAAYLAFLLYIRRYFHQSRHEGAH